MPAWADCRARAFCRPAPPARRQADLLGRRSPSPSLRRRGSRPRRRGVRGGRTDRRGPRRSVGPGVHARSALHYAGVAPARLRGIASGGGMVPALPVALAHPGLRLRCGLAGRGRAPRAPPPALCPAAEELLPHAAADRARLEGASLRRRGARLPRYGQQRHPRRPRGIRACRLRSGGNGRCSTPIRGSTMLP